MVLSLVTALVAGPGGFSPERLLILALAGGMACAGASALNNYFDRDIDAVMLRTRNRILPRKKVRPGIVLILGLGLVAFSLVISLRLGWPVFWSLGAGALIYVVIYTIWLKRRHPLNIIVGGLSGSCAVLAGWFAVTRELSPAPWLIALIVFLWTPGHFWSFALVHEESYREAKIPMLPVVAGARRTAGYITLHSLLLMIATTLLYHFGPFGGIYLAGSLILGHLFMVSSLSLWKRPSARQAWRNYKFSGLYLLCLFLLMAADILF